ncbi:MAG: sugar ABC transporter ATP-binding protein, partial [Ktedonobacteraceae bacterium]|nr:sugar ABC transporter ATP-binding protein [Ktedonobacteraceae bacterium]
MTDNILPVADSPGQSSESAPRLQLRGISKSFGAVRALNNVDFEVYAGEVVGLVGDNGAGKSTLIKVIAGVGPCDEGEIFVEGQSVKITSPQAATRLGIETVYQDLALCDNLDVVSNLFLGRERRRFQVLNEIEMERRSLQVLSSLGVRIPSIRTPVASLSGGQRQSIAVAKTILRDARVV